MGPIFLFALNAHHTKTLKKYADYHRKNIILEVRISTEFQLSIIAEQNRCGVYFSIVHPTKVPIHKIQASFMFSYCLELNLVLNTFLYTCKFLSVFT